LRAIVVETHRAAAASVLVVVVVVVGGGVDGRSGDAVAVGGLESLDAWDSFAGMTVGHGGGGLVRLDIVAGDASD